MRKQAIVIILAFCLLVPIAQAFTIDGPLNWVGPVGGNVRFNMTVTTTQYSIVNTLSRFNNLRTGTPVLGNLAFDAAPTVNMTITAITRDTLTYVVETTSPGPVDTYIYYRRNVNNHPLNRPAEVTGGTFTYNGATGTTTVLTTGSPVTVTIRYVYPVSQSITTNASSLIQALVLITIASAFIYIGGARAGVDNERLMQIVIIIAFLMMVAYLAHGWGV